MTMFTLTLALFIKLVLADSVTNESDSSNCSGLPWSAVAMTMREARAQTTVVFLNDTIEMPEEMLIDLNTDFADSMTKLSLFHCTLFDPGSQLSPPLARFFSGLADKCMRMSCTFLVLCNVAITQQIAQTMMKLNLFRPWTLWISANDAFVNHLQDENIGGTGVPIAVPINQTGLCPDAMVVSSKSNNRIQQLAVFSSQSQNGSRQQLFLSGTAGQVDSYRLLNLLNDTIVVGIKELAPYLDHDEITIGNITRKRYKGMCIKILEVFAKVMNFSYKIVPFDKAGSKRRTGSQMETWDGIIGAAANMSIDLALGALTITEDRASVVDFTSHFLEDASAILSPKPLTLSRVLIFFKVFPWQVWVLLFVAFLAVGPCLVTVEYVIHEKSFRGCLQKSNLWHAWWTLGTSIIQQGDIEVKSAAARSLAVFWLLFLVILIGTYTGLLLAFVSFPGTRPAIESMQQLISSDSPFPLALHPSATESYIKEGSTPMTEAIAKRWKTVPNFVFPITPKSALNYLTSNNYVLLSEKLTFQYIISRQRQLCQCCPFYQSQNNFLKHFYSFAVPKNSALLGSFNVILNRLISTGVIEKWLEESLPDSNLCEMADKRLSTGGHHRAMSLTDLQGAFYILAVGLSTAVFTLIIERGLIKSTTSRVINKVGLTSDVPAVSVK